MIGKSQNCLYLIVMSIIILIFIPFIVAGYAHHRVNTTYNRNLQRLSKGRISGREAAEAVMRSAGINDVEVVECKGKLTDHYDPTNKRLALSSLNYRGYSLAALGVAAHEAGHAIQHKQEYAPLNLRMTLVPVTSFASQALPNVIIAAFFFGLGPIFLNIAILIYLILTIFQLITLPVEFDASIRAKKQLVGLGIIDSDEIDGVNETLDAAALTYVAAFITSLGMLLYFLLQRR